MLADQAQSVRRVKPFEPLEHLLLKIAPVGAIVQRHGMRDDRDERYGGDPALMRVTEKHIEMCVRADESRDGVRSCAAANKAPHAKPLRPRLEAHDGAKRGPPIFKNNVRSGRPCRPRLTSRTVQGRMARGGMCGQSSAAWSFRSLALTTSIRSTDRTRSRLGAAEMTPRSRSVSSAGPTAGSASMPCMVEEHLGTSAPGRRFFRRARSSLVRSFFEVAASAILSRHEE